MKAPPPKPKVFLVEFAASTWIGHRANTLAALHKALLARGFMVDCGISTSADSEILAALNAKPVFSLMPWPAVVSDGISGEIESFLVYGDTAPAEFENFLAESEGTDIVILNTASENELWAFACWMKTRAAHLRPKVVINVMLPQFFDPVTEEPTQRGRLLRVAVKSLMALQSPDKLLFLALTERLRNLFSTLTSAPFQVSVTPLDFSSFVRSPEDAMQSRPVCIAVAGGPKQIKGEALIPEIAKMLHVIHPEVMFQAQNWPKNIPMPGNVEITPAGVDRRTYIDLFKRCDLSLIMYDPVYYKHGASGVFEEAASAGHGVVVTQNTWMTPFVDSGVVEGICVPFGDAKVATEALCRLIERVPELRKKSVLNGQAWAQTRDVEVYLDQVFNMLCPGQNLARSL